MNDYNDNPNPAPIWALLILSSCLLWGAIGYMIWMAVR